MPLLLFCLNLNKLDKPDLPPLNPNITLLCGYLSIKEKNALTIIFKLKSFIFNLSPPFNPNLRLKENLSTRENELEVLPPFVHLLRDTTFK